jgi:hypothetical protein
MSCLIQVDHETLPFSVVVEDDERVVYAYLEQYGKIVGDVWLYNCGAAPIQPEWKDRSKLPFANPSDYVVVSDVLRITAANELSVAWITEDDSLQHVELYVRGELLAVLAPNAKPGWCRNAARGGPLAKTLSGSATCFQARHGTKGTSEKGSHG